MKKLIAVTILFFACALVLLSAHLVYAAESKIHILFDNGVTKEMDAKQVKSQTQLAEWMQGDMIRVMSRYVKEGVTASLIENRQQFKAQANNYLLTVKITEYKPGSKAARIVVGYGAGGVTLKIHYELIGSGNKTIISQDDSVFSGREWINAARKLNQNMAKAIIEKLK